MPAKLLVAAIDLPSGFVKGDIVEVYPGTYQWGGKEGLPNFIRVTISNREKSQVDAYLDQIVKYFDYLIIGSNANGVRARISVDAAVSGSIDQEIKQAIIDYILAGADTDTEVAMAPAGQQVPNSITVDISLPDDATRTPTLQQMKFNINDFGSEQIMPRRYFFNAASVDSVVASGGETTITAAVALANIIDRLAV